MSAVPVKPAGRIFACESHYLRMSGLLVVLLLSGVTSALGADELEGRKIISARVSNLFMQERFGELERLADQYRMTGERTSSGLWKLTLFYSGISDVADGNNINETYWNSIEARARRWVEEYPASPTPRIAYSLILIGHAWKFRGSGWAEEVNPDARKPFHEYLNKARVYLLEHKDIAGSDPRWYEAMLSVALAEDWDIKRFNKLVDEATTRHPYFYQIYFGAINYLTPKSHGNRQQIEAFANFAVSKTVDMDGMGMYARVYWYAAQAHFRDHLFTDSSVVWDKMKKGIADVLQRYPDQWNINNFAHFACLAWDKDETRGLMGRIQGAPIPQAWEDRTQYQQCRTWAFTGSPGPARLAAPATSRGG